jgi:hypothetical protein
VSSAEGVPSPLRLTRSPRLDNALRLGWESFSRTLVAAGPEEGARWLSARTSDPELAEIAEPLLTSVLGDDPDEAADALFGLAELAEETEDDLLADTLWEGVLGLAQGADDGDLIAEATRRLALVAERNGDPLAAAEFLIEFLNWRRQPGHTSDPEDVEAAFDEIVRLANVDGAQQAVAQYAYRQVGFTKLLDADDPRAVEGDWEPDLLPYQSWSE